MKAIEKLLYSIEVHDPKAIDAIFQGGVDPNSEHEGKKLIDLMISMYTRSPRFKQCVQSFVNHGLIFTDDVLLVILLDDAEKLESLIFEDDSIISRRWKIENAYTQMVGAGLLHICAEFNHVSCAKILLDNGMEVNDTAGTDENGFGGQTPIFHTVNQNENQSADMMELLLAHGADVTSTIKGILWGKGFPWETLIPGVNAISYAMLGLLPQMHRKEQTIANTVKRLLQHAYGDNLEIPNIPNKYLLN